MPVGPVVVMHRFAHGDLSALVVSESSTYTHRGYIPNEADLVPTIDDRPAGLASADMEDDRWPRVEDLSWEHDGDLSWLCCERLVEQVRADDVPLVCSEVFREVGIAVVDGGTSFLRIEFCPNCGVLLPSSLRDEWFDRLEALGIDPDDDALPEEFRSSRWWRERSA